MKELSGKVAVVTGAASGIGRGIAQELAARDVAVVMADVEEAPLAAAAADLEADGGRVLAVPTDVADAKSVEALADAAVSRFGAIHIACNNAGVSGLFGRAWATPEEDWRWVIDVNLWGVINGVRTFVPRILATGEEGHVVNTGSAACFEGMPGMAPYAATKHAVLGISEVLKKEFLAAGVPVGVSVLIPGKLINTKILESERNFPERLGAPERDPDPLPALVKHLFSQTFATSDDPGRSPAAAVVEGILADTFVITDDPDLCATWGQHHGALASGVTPVWPPQ
jgi:NAD(P)-dependent dehydrogenase (short-subunit alcohol dehydrogenase family)